MTTIDEFAQQIAKALLNARTPVEMENILSRVDKLVYENSNSPISLDDKEMLLHSIYASVHPYAIKDFENKYYLDLINHMLQQIAESKR